MEEPLRAPLEIGFDYTRSLGPVLGEFMTALAARRILGSRGADGRVHAPPFEYDPVTFAPPAELVEVGPEGTVATWTWVAEPLEGQPLAHPFAWALIRLDGADTAMLHAVDAGSAAAMATGMRVRARWAASPAGHISDIACFEPCRADEPAGLAEDRRQPAGQEPVTMVTTPVRLHYEHTASPGESEFLRGLADGPPARAALPGLRQGLHPAARRLPHRRGPDRRGGGAARHRHRDHVLRGQRAVPRASGCPRRTSRHRSCSTAPTSRSST